MWNFGVWKGFLYERHEMFRMMRQYRRLWWRQKMSSGI